ncbi:MAG: hypothetical protein KIPDCIKN_01329 [Haliscomenobacter sp.]|jgi:hypothetical protein|nr:hypothetical protein [Haliscomenobacter sp.]
MDYCQSLLNRFYWELNHAPCRIANLLYSLFSGHRAGKFLGKKACNLFYLGRDSSFFYLLNRFQTALGSCLVLRTSLRLQPQPAVLPHPAVFAPGLGVCSFFARPKKEPKKGRSSALPLRGKRLRFMGFNRFEHRSLLYPACKAVDPIRRSRSSNGNGVSHGLRAAEGKSPDRSVCGVGGGPTIG